MKTTEVLSELKRRFPNEPEYHQAVEEVLSTIEDVYNEHPEFDRYNLIEPVVHSRQNVFISGNLGR